MSDDDTERRLAQAAYRYVNMLELELAHEDPAAVAHALFLLAEAAERQRERWLRRLKPTVKAG